MDKNQTHAHQTNPLYQNPIGTKPTQSKPDLHIRRSKLRSPQNPHRSRLHRNPPDLLPPIKTPSEPTQNQNLPCHTNLHAWLAITHTPHDELHTKRPKQLRWQVLNERAWWQRLGDSKRKRELGDSDLVIRREREREGMREAWQWRETKRGDERAITEYCSKRERDLNELKYTKFFWHSAIVLSHIWDGTVALCQKNLYAKCNLHLAFDRPIVDALTKSIWVTNKQTMQLLISLS